METEFQGDSSRWGEPGDDCKQSLALPVRGDRSSLEVGKTVLVAAHGNSLRSLVMEIEGLSPEAIVEREIPTGTPMAYSLTSGVWSRLDLN